jgi:hypothetical protein
MSKTSLRGALDVGQTLRDGGVNTFIWDRLSDRLTTLWTLCRPTMTVRKGEKKRRRRRKVSYFLATPMY